MSEERTLLQISDLDGGIAVKCDLKNESDKISIAIVLFDLLSRYPELMGMIDCICAMADRDKDFEKKKRSGTIEIPDFNKILKNK